MSLAPRLREIRSGFEPAFWIANLTELFERLAYYATAAVLAIYLNEQLHFSSQLTGWLIGTFGLVVWFLPILGGTLADRFGFRRALMFAYLVMTIGLFSARVALGTLDGASAPRAFRQVAGAGNPARAGAGTGSGEAVRSRHDGPRIERKRSLARLFDLLHHCEYRRRARPHHRLAGAEATGAGHRECVSRGGGQRLPDVLDDAAFLPGADAVRRGEGGERFGSDSEHVRGAGQSADSLRFC